MQHIRKHLAIAVCLLTLAACGGGGGGGSPVAGLPWPVDPGTARALTGGSAPPDMTSSQIEGRLDELRREADTLRVNDVLVFTDTGFPDRINVSCSASTCTGTYFGERLEFRLSGESDVNVTDEFQAVMTRNGVSIAQGRGRAHFANLEVTLEVYGYGGWLEHSYFAVEGGISENEDFGYGTSYAIGDATGTNPPGTGRATWMGVMVGADASVSETIGDAIQGDATITITDLSNPGIDVDFTNIYNLNTQNRRSDMYWSNIPLTNGSFRTGSNGNSIEGRFYGPNHEEVGSIFERDQVIGAFGAKRQ